jgi:hypothetical protein|mmetsp:Transcript_24098/g.43677  ORF Transcript_24098/g.43677 Transcript_24098/m.43677 type:complete len:132 (+) Transcript_24098:202-597(+)
MILRQGDRSNNQRYQKNSQYRFSFKGGSLFKNANTTTSAWKVIRNAKHQQDDEELILSEKMTLSAINRHRVCEKSLVHAFTNQGPEGPGLRQSLFNQEIVGLDQSRTIAISLQQLILYSSNQEFHSKTMLW